MDFLRSAAASTVETDDAGVRVEFGSPPPRFDCSTAEGVAAAVAYVEEHGYAVIANAMGPGEVEEATALFWQHWADVKACGLWPYHVRRDDPSSWRYFPLASAVGIVGTCGIGQSNFLWYCRTRPTVRRVFAALWKDDALLTSFDGCGVFRPWHYTPPGGGIFGLCARRQRPGGPLEGGPLSSEEALGWCSRSGWWHVDQNVIARPGRHCVQGLVALTDNDERTGGLLVIPGSHKREGELAPLAEGLKADFIRIPPHYPAVEGVAGRLVHCKAGDLVLWDSRTIHCSAPAYRTPAPPPAGQPWSLLRLVAYVCMTPAAMAGPPGSEERRAVLGGRVRAYTRNQSTNHWPHMVRPNDDPKQLPQRWVGGASSDVRCLLLGVAPGDDEGLAAADREGQGAAAELEVANQKA